MKYNCVHVFLYNLTFTFMTFSSSDILKLRYCHRVLIAFMLCLQVCGLEFSELTLNRLT
jgi:hypothetical protein